MLDFQLTCLIILLLFIVFCGRYKVVTYKLKHPSFILILVILTSVAIVTIPVQHWTQSHSANMHFKHDSTVVRAHHCQFATVNHISAEI